MTLRRVYLRDSELDRTTYPDLRDRVVAFEQDGAIHETRAYPGHPATALAKGRPRPLAGLDRSLTGRRSVRALGRTLPSPRDLGRLLQFAHGVCAGEGRGPVPSSGGLQALELYVTAIEPGWLAEGVHHYNRAAHRLSRVADGAGREGWVDRVPSLGLVEGGALLWILVGDAARVEAKYGDRGGRFLLLEAGHLMQNLCLLSASLGMSTVPLGAALESEVAKALRLPAGDAVLYVGVCGPAKI